MRSAYSPCLNRTLDDMNKRLEEMAKTRHVSNIGNIPRPPGYRHVCVFIGAEVGNAHKREFERFIAEQFDGARVKYLEDIVTKPDRTSGKDVPGTGGRSDAFFVVHQDDVGKFANSKRLEMEIRWLEDVLINEMCQSEDGSSIYPERVINYCVGVMPNP